MFMTSDSFTVLQTRVCMFLDLSLISSNPHSQRYLQWDDYFMSVAFLSAQRSKDPNKQVRPPLAAPNPRNEPAPWAAAAADRAPGWARAAGPCVHWLARLSHARASLARSLQVGAVIVSPDNIILSIGYNGFPRGCPDERLPWSKKSRSGNVLDTKYPYVRGAPPDAGGRRGATCFGMYCSSGARQLAACGVPVRASAGCCTASAGGRTAGEGGRRLLT
jgi:hypothetical protein